MRERIARHREERPASWRTVEAPVQLAAALREVESESFVIIDCLTLWLANVLFPQQAAAIDESGFAQERDALLQALAVAVCDGVIISNEVGLSIVPDNAAARRFRDEQGRLNQQVAALCQRVIFVAAGLPLTLK